MLTELHDSVLDYIVKFWKKNKGKMMSDSGVNPDYKKLKENTGKVVKDIDNNYLRTAMTYLAEIGYLYRIESEDNNKIHKYAPTPRGIDMTKHWCKREENYKWLINGIMGFAGIIVGVVLSYILKSC